MDGQKERQTAKKGAKQGFNPFTKNSGTTKNTIAGKIPADSKAANVNKSTSDQRFFTAPGLRIPLYDARGKRITHARDGRVTVHKMSRQKLLDEYVRKYAGDEKVDEMEGKKEAEKWTKNQIGDWITEVETMAYGQGPKGTTMKERKEGHGDNNGTKMRGNGTGTREEKPKGRMTRSMSEEMKALLAMEEESEDEPVPTPTSSSKQWPTDVGDAKTMNSDVNGKRKLPAQESQATNKRIKLDTANAELPSSITKKLATAAPAQAKDTITASPKRKSDPSNSITPSKHKSDIKSDMPSAKRKPAIDTNHRNKQSTKAQPPGEPQQKPHHPDTFDWNHANGDLYIPASIFRLNEPEKHPFLATFSLDPTFKPSSHHVTLTTPLRALPLPSSRAHLLVSAASRSHHTPTIQALVIPQRDLENQRGATAAGKKIPPPHRRRRNMIAPFLKPGTHGWDYEKHAWGFERDQDLQTGRGHQVEPEDERRLEGGEMSWEAFRGKYPGVRGRGGMWPCGCVEMGEEGESEEE